MKLKLILFIIIASNMFAISQLDQLECYNINGADYPRDIIINSKGESVIIGGTSNEVAFLVVDSNGVEKINREIDMGPFYSTGLGIEGSRHSGYIVTGIRSHQGFGFNYIPFVLEIDSIGNKVWEREYSIYPTSGPTAISRKLLRVGDHIFFAHLDSLRKLNLRSKEELVVSTNGMINSGFESVIMASKNNKIFILGFQSGFKILVTDLDFNLLESFQIDQNIENIYDMKIMDDEKIVICGTMNWKWKMIQTSLTKDNDWEMEYDISGYNVGYPYGIQILPSGFLLVGSMAKSEPSGWCAMSIKVSKSGNIEWFKQIGDVDVNNGADAVAENRLIITGRKRCELSFSDIFVTELDTTEVNKITSIDIHDDISENIVFPNPFCDIIYLSKNIGYKYKIVTVSGRIVKTGKCIDGQIELSNLVNGLYVLILDDRDGNVSMKRIIKNSQMP